jgi:N-acetylmuramoyl-L-alanine amidase
VRKLVVTGVMAAAAMAGAGAACGVAQGAGAGSAAATTAAPSTAGGAGTAALTAMMPPPPPSRLRDSPPKPAITRDFIHYGPTRRAETAAYARRHYGVSTDRVHPRVIVLHFTDSGPGSYPGVHALFDANQPNGGELPGVCAQFVVDQDGTIYQQVPLKLMCRHAIGLNDRALGIEMIQQQGISSHWADQQILHRRPQIRSVLRLVRWLQARYHIARRNVIGHAMANDSPFFHDLEGWRNDHTDWQREDVLALRRRL